MFRLTAAVIGLFFCTLLCSYAHAEVWRRYTNERFGTAAERPANWKANPPPTNGDGLTFVSPDKRATLKIFGGYNLGSEFYRIMLQPGEGETISYKIARRRVFVVSGKRNANIFYTKRILSCKDRVWNSIDVEYPASEKEHYDSLVAHVAKSLRSSFCGE